MILHFTFLTGEVVTQVLVCVGLYFTKERSKENLLIFSGVQYIWVVFGGLGFFMLSYQFYAGSKLIIQKVNFEETNSNQTLSDTFVKLVIAIGIFYTVTWVAEVIAVWMIDPFELYRSIAIVSVTHFQCIFTDTCSTLLLFSAIFTIKRGIKMNHTQLRENFSAIRNFMVIFGVWEVTNITQYVDFVVLLSQGKDPATHLQHNVLNIIKIGGIVLAEVYITLMLV